MARSKEFDPEVALRAAMNLFLRQGYEATSMSDLVAHIGISRASLYATFGAKEELYRSAIQLYRDSRRIDPVELLARPGPVIPLIHTLLNEFAEQAARPDGAGACLVVNAAIERMDVDDEVAKQVEASWESLETALYMALVRAKTQGELSEAADPKAQARYLLVVLQGIRVFSRSSDAKRRLDAAVEQAVASLR